MCTPVAAEAHSDALPPPVRRAMASALILLRNRGMVAALPLLQRCFRLFRCADKQAEEADAT